MDEYISRESVEKYIEAGLNNPDKAKAFGHDAIEILAEVHYMPAADVAPVQKWISVKESLPRDSDCVLVIASGKFENITLENAIEIATFDMSEGWILEMWPEWENPKVTYWMQLPEAPKEDDDGK